jgi:hypothetical protein
MICKAACAYKCIDVKWCNVLCLFCCAPPSWKSFERNEETYLIVFAVVAISFSSCRPDTTNRESASIDSLSISKKATTGANRKRILDNFTDVPEEIEGCACYYSESEGKYGAAEYFFVAGFDSVAFMSINNTKLKLKLVSTGREPLSFGDYDYIDVYRTEGYDVTLDIKYVEEERDSVSQEEDESWYTNGTITIQSGDGKREEIIFFGSCGC